MILPILGSGKVHKSFQTFVFCFFTLLSIVFVSFEHFVISFPFIEEKFISLILFKKKEERDKYINRSDFLSRVTCLMLSHYCLFGWDNSVRNLRRERKTLSKLMQKRLSEEERTRLFQTWGISLKSKRRRLQLINRLWSDPKNMNHVQESAAIVAKLVKFAEQGQSLKGNFGLSFITTPPQKSRSFSWKNTRTSLL